MISDETAFVWEPYTDDSGASKQRIEGGAEISSFVAASIEPFLSMSRVRLAAVRSEDRALLVMARLGETSGAFVVEARGGSLSKALDVDVPIQQAGFVPRSEREYLLRIDLDGSEDYQIFRVQDERAWLISDGVSRHGSFAWSPSGRYLAYTSNARDATSLDVYLSDGIGPSARPALLRKGLWNIEGWSQEESIVLLKELDSLTTSTLHLWDRQSGKTRRISAAGDACLRSFHTPGYVYALTDRGSEWIHLQRWSHLTGAWQDLTPELQWDIDQLARSGDSRRLAFTVNEDGLSRLFVMEVESQQTMEKKLPYAAAIVDNLQFVGSSYDLAMTVDGLTEPANVFIRDESTGANVAWTAQRAESRFGPASSPLLGRVPSFDGTPIPFWLFEAQGSIAPSPVLLWIHGGPEEQFRPWYNPLIHYLNSILGISVIAPNIRGSEGYGRSYLKQDDGPLRWDAVRDIGAILDWISRQPQLDNQRMGIYGGSYGGFIVLASLIEYPGRFQAACDFVGISDIATFLENTRDYRKPSRRLEYGDERKPEVRAFLDRLSPLRRASEITTPLFVAHGAQDPRVSLSEADQIVEAVRAGGTPVWYFVAENEGHGFSRRTNRDTFYELMATFWLRYLKGDLDCGSLPDSECTVHPRPRRILP